MSEATLPDDALELEPETSGEDLARRWGWTAVAAVGLLAYANTFQAPFIFDGKNYIEDNPKIRAFAALRERGAWPTRDDWEQLYRFAPTRVLGNLTFAVNHGLAGYDPISWHATSLAIHIVAGWAFYGAARAALRSPKLPPRYGAAAERLALVTALLWTAHPLCTQSVTYLYQRFESLMGMFCLLVVYATARYAATERLRWAVLGVGACLLGMASKEVMITAPLVVLWYDRVFLAESFAELFRRRGGYYFALACTWLLSAYLIRETKSAYPNAGILDYTRVTAQEYALAQTGVVLHYFRLVVWPWNQNIDYAWKAPVVWKLGERWPSAVDWRALLPPLAAMTILLATTAVWIFHRPALGFLAGTVLLVLAPTSSFAPIVDLAFEHRMYLPSAAAVALVVVCGYEAIGRMLRRLGRSEDDVETVRLVTSWIVIAALVVLTLRRNHDYRSHTALWRDVCLKAPHNPRAAYNYGVYLQLEGSRPNDPVIDQAIEQYFATLALDPNYADAHLNLGALYAWRGDPTKAEAHYQELLKLRPADPQALWGLASANEHLNKPDWAKYYVDWLLQVDPQHADGKLLKERLLAASAATAPAVPSVGTADATGAPTSPGASGSTSSAVPTPNAPTPRE